MNLHRLLEKGIHTVESNTTLAHVARCMRDFDTDVILVTDRDLSCVKGVVTAADILDAVAMGFDTTVARVQDLDPREVPQIRAEDLDAACVKRLARQGWRYFAVVDDRQRPIGLVAVDQVRRRPLLAAA